MASALRMLAQNAKKRLSTAGQNYLETEKATISYLSDGNYAIVANNQKIKEDPLFEKVKRLLEKEDILNGEFPLVLECFNCGTKYSYSKSDMETLFRE